MQRREHRHDRRQVRVATANRANSPAIFTTWLDANGDITVAIKEYHSDTGTQQLHAIEIGTLAETSARSAKSANTGNTMLKSHLIQHL
jgi:hypothetical protein